MMIKNLKFLFVVILIFRISAGAQTRQDLLDVSVQAGFGNYSMEQLKALNDYNESFLPFTVNMVDNFDPGFHFGGSVQTTIHQKIRVGIFYQYYTTGSRQGLKDYSGYYAFDQILNGHLIGLEPGYIILDRNSFRISAVVQAGVLFTGMEMIETLELMGYETSNSEKLSAVSYSFTPAVKVTLPVYYKISCFAYAGRMFDTGGYLHLSDNKDAVLQVNDEKVKTGWSGWRIVVGADINIIRRKLSR